MAAREKIFPRSFEEAHFSPSSMRLSLPFYSPPKCAEENEKKRKTRQKKAMKLAVPSFFVSPSKKKKRSKKESISHHDAAFGSVASSSSSSDDSSTSSRLNASPRSVLLPFPAPDLFDGKISARELEAVLRRISPNATAADPAGAADGEITEAEIEALGEALEPEAAEAELREAFTVFDTDGDGKISAEELQGVFVMLGDEGCTLEDCRRMIHGVDSDGDGFVCFNDFARMMGGR